MHLTSIPVSRIAFILVLGGAALVAACSDDPASTTPKTPPLSLGDGGYVEAFEPDASKSIVDGSYVDPTGSVIRTDRFVTKVVSFTPGSCAGFGSTEMPGVILGPPVGAGDRSGGVDVVSLGIGGEIVVSFEPNAIVDGPGPDFVVFENAFFAGGNSAQPSADPGEVSVSEDGVSWKTYECTASSAPYGTCAGWHPVYSAPGSGISPIDPDKAGGDAYDLSSLGITKARFVRIRDKSTETCEGQPKPNNLGFDLDAIAILHAETP
ncbi:MAG TPA: hypothetical protein VM925_03180 [Labilithrix sp.]|nr:hypothetical protein [Labilithrix sp.]